jgi:hypothetical protein
MHIKIHGGAGIDVNICEKNCLWGLIKVPNGGWITLSQSQFDYYIDHLVKSGQR